MTRALVLLVLALSACATHEGAPGSGSLDAFDRAMRDWMAAHHVSRGSVAVMRDDHLVFAAGYRGRRANERVPVWSMSKAITGVCIATLVQDGSLRFDEPIGPWLARIARAAAPADPRLAQVTVGQRLGDQNDARGGAIHEKRGTWFVLTDDGVAWFASYDGVHIDTDPDAVNALHDALWQAHRRVLRWPARDQFPAMGVQPLV